MTSISKSVHIDRLDDVHIDVKPNIYIDFNKENNKEGSKFKITDRVAISKYKNIFAKG